MMRYEAIKPFDTVLNLADHQLWGGVRDSNPQLQGE